jgi:pimeloyl-ACP methyl ester carboxylesterase
MANTGYAPIGDLDVYYEIHGTGRPLLLLHGANMTVDTMGPLVSGLAETHQVIAPEMQGHGRTADADRPITYEGMADDSAGLLRHLEIESAFVVGYSMGAGIALQLAIRHPQSVHKLVVISGSYAYDGLHAEAIELFQSLSPEMFAGSPIEAEFQRLAPHAGDFPTLVRKLKALLTTPFAWPEEDIRAIPAPTLIIVGDSDVVRVDHAVQLFKLRGGVMGDLDGLPASQLAVLPGTSHFTPQGSRVLDRADWMLAMMRPFLAA